MQVLDRNSVQEGGNGDFFSISIFELYITECKEKLSILEVLLFVFLQTQ